MLLKSKYKILSDYNLIVEFHKGQIDLNSYVKFKKNLLNDNNFKSGCNYFIHFKDVTFESDNHEELDKFKTFINEFLIARPITDACGSVS